MEHRTSSEFQKAQRHSCDSIKGSPSPARTPASQQRMHSLTRRRTCKHSSSQAEATAQRKNPKNQANPKRGSSPPRHQSTVEMTRHGEGKGATLGPPSRLDGGGRNPRRPSEQQHQRRRRRQQQPSSRSSPRDKPCPPFLRSQQPPRWPYPRLRKTLSLQKLPFPPPPPPPTLFPFFLLRLGGDDDERRDGTERGRGLNE